VYAPEYAVRARGRSDRVTHSDHGQRAAPHSSDEPRAIRKKDALSARVNLPQPSAPMRNWETSCGTERSC